MGSGKSTLLRAILDEEPRPESVLYDTYRQTQASDAAGKNRDFSHYSDLKQMRGRQVGDRVIEPMADREMYPRVICQVDSLPRLLLENAAAPAFDLVILDESESIFAHLSAATLRERHNVIRLMVDLLRRARRIICLDGHLGQRTFDFLTLHRIPCSPMLVNKHAPERPLEFEFLEGKEGLQQWRDAIFRALEDGENVFVVSMSSDKAQELGAEVTSSKLVDEGGVLIITRHSDGEVKRGLEDVNSTWKKRLVIISPTVEAGVDFNQRWFHRMFLYICQQSTHPRGLDQMKGRVRQLEDPSVLCFVQQGIKLPTEAQEGDAYLIRFGSNPRPPRLGLEEMYQWFLWGDRKMAQRGLDGFCESAVTRLLAHNEKEILNGNTHFYEEFSELLQNDGHRVLGVRAKAPTEGEALEAEAPPRGKFLLEEMIEAPDITPAQFVEIQARVLKRRDAEGEKVQLDKYKLGKFYGVPRLSEDFLRTFGVYPNRNITFLLQVVDPGYAFDGEEIGRQRYPPLMAAIAREVLQVLGFPHPLQHEHVTGTLQDLRRALAAAAFFSDFSNTVKLFHARALGNGDPLATQKSATISLNHVFAMLGLRLKSASNGRKELKGGAQEGGKRRRVHVYGGWYIERDRGSRTLPVVGPPGADLMGQLLKLRLEGSPELKARISDELREHLDGLAFGWPEMVTLGDDCMIHRQ
jgi:hypothetical protein